MKENDVRTSNSIMGYLLLKDGSFHIIEMIATLIRRYNVDIKFDEETNAFTFKFGEYIVGASFVNSPMGNDDAKEACKYNFLWQNAEEIVSNHKAHVLLTILNCHNKLEGYKLFTNIMSVLANFDNTIAVYMPAQNMTLNAKTYVEDARVLVTGKNPIHLWICICPVELEDATIVYTYGLNEFGKNEIEVRSTDKHYMEMFDFVYNLCDYILTQNVSIESGDNFKTVNGETVSAIVNNGVYIDRVSTKFNM
ncbi:MAG: DUF4261 domain-containing protein [Clostridia bacterium]|nr:DUF4261 domain-containing protein [Clostridia bacterium]